MSVSRVIGHRGVAGHAPENTLASFRKAAELGARWVEFETKLGCDGNVVRNPKAGGRANLPAPMISSIKLETMAVATPLAPEYPGALLVGWGVEAVFTAYPDQILWV